MAPDPYTVRPNAPSLRYTGSSFARRFSSRFDASCRRSSRATSRTNYRTGSRSSGSGRPPSSQPPNTHCPRTRYGKRSPRRSTRQAGVTSEDAFSAVMCAFSERLSRGQAREVFLGLPEPLRPLVERCMLHRAEPGFVFGREELLRRTGDHLHLDAPRAEAIAHAVLAGLKRVLPE